MYQGTKGASSPKKRYSGNRYRIISHSFESLLSCPPYRALPPIERYLLLELLRLADRVGTDEPLRVSCEDAANMLGMSRRHGARALATLRERGFIFREVDPIYLMDRKGIASKWRITCLPYKGEKPTLDYLKKAEKGRENEPFITPEMCNTYQSPEQDTYPFTDNMDGLEADVAKRSPLL
jgi:hypothetical protein